MDVRRDVARAPSRPAQPAPPHAPARAERPGRGAGSVPRQDELSGLLATSVQQRTLQRSAVRRGTVSAPLIQRNGESAALLGELAQPQVLEPQALEAQVKIVRKLEEATTEWKRTFTGERQMKPIYPDDPELCLGVIDLTLEDIDSDEGLIKANELIDVGTANSLRRNDHPLVLTAGVERAVVENTLRTMSGARQIEYLRKSGLPNREWRILIEVHYIRARPKDKPQFHKDTLGQTLFVNLNYAIDAPMTGPEYMVNPAPLDEWDSVTSTSLPGVFNEDLGVVRKRLAPLTTIQVDTVPAHGAVAFVDEAIHHRTPVRGHRAVRGSKVKEFIQERIGKAGYAERKKEYDSYLWWKWWTPAERYSRKDQRWFKFLAIAESGSAASFTRVDLERAGMGSWADEIIAFGDRESRTVSIPKLKGGSPQDVRPSGDGKPPPLKRRMSVLASQGLLPPDPEGPRRFFRSWVRAVRR